MSKKTRSTAPTSRDDAETRPELWVPEQSRERYPSALLEARSALTALTSPHWHDSLENRVTARVRFSLATTKHDGIMPGSVSRPATNQYISKPAVWADGRPSSRFSTLQSKTREDWTTEDHAAWKRWERSEEAAPAFHKEVSDIVDAVRENPERGWAFFLHDQALQLVDRNIAREQRAAETEAIRLGIELCPVCEESDRATIGGVAKRDLLGDPAFRGPVVRSCLACWHALSRKYAHELHHKVTTSGLTREESATKMLTELELI